MRILLIEQSQPRHDDLNAGIWIVAVMFNRAQAPSHSDPVWVLAPDFAQIVDRNDSSASRFFQPQIRGIGIPQATSIGEAEGTPNVIRVRQNLLPSSVVS